MAKVVLWNFDGPINDHRLRGAPYSVCIYRDSYDSLIQNPAIFPLDHDDVVVNNLPFLKIVLEVLQKNGVQSILFPCHVSLDNALNIEPKVYDALDAIFGKKRKYLKLDDSKRHEVVTDGKNAAQVKLEMLNSVIDQYKTKITKPSDIVWLSRDKDDDLIAKSAGVDFIISRLKGQPSFEEDQSYLFELLLRAIPLKDTILTLDKMLSSGRSVVADISEIYHFKQQLILYIIKNIYDIREKQLLLRKELYVYLNELPKDYTQWYAQQKTLSIENAKKELQTDYESLINFRKKYFDTKLKPALNKNEYSASNKDIYNTLSRELLLLVVSMIESTKWSTMVLSGVKIETKSGTMIVPTGIAKIYNIVRSAAGDSEWTVAFDKVVSYGEHASKDRKSLFNFKLRDDKTQEFYDSLKSAYEKKKDDNYLL